MRLGLFSVTTDAGLRVARGPVGEGPSELLLEARPLSAFLAEASSSELDALLHGPSGGPVPEGTRVAPPIAAELVWASGVTYEQSRDARMEESGDLDFYDLVYEAERPELFIKSSADRVRADGEPIAIRSDSTWNVPEPEVGVVANSRREIVGYVIGNDVSSRSIEGANPLYLPQAKTYDGACAIGPCLVPAVSAPALADLTITLDIRRDGQSAFRASVSAGRMRRQPAELVEWLFRAQRFPNGVVLLTGTGIVPDKGFSLCKDDEVTISVEGLGALRNTVEVVGS